MWPVILTPIAKGLLTGASLMIGALAEGETRVRGFGRSGDTESTLRAIRALGAGVEEEADDELVVRGVGLRGLRAPAEPIDCGNAGTLLRLLTGILAGQSGTFELTGDESLRSRPMERVAEPLARMGARIQTTAGRAPLTIEGTDALRGIDYQLPVASAQVKSAILLAGLNATETTTVVEPVPTRDHTELILEAAGARVRRRPASVSIEPTSPPRRRSSSPQRCSPARSSRSTTSASTRDERDCSTSSNGWVHASTSSTGARSRANGSETWRSAPPS